VVTALQSIIARETKPGERLVVSIASIDGGHAPNVVVDQVVLRGTIRWFDPSQRERALERIERVAAGVCTALRAEARFQVDASTPVTRSSVKEVDVLRSAVQSSGRAQLVDPGPITASEDFAYFLQQKPGCFFGIGAGGPGAPPHHHHSFDIDERGVGLMTEIYARTALQMLAPPR
jgi:amidohydrolase